MIRISVWFASIQHRLCAPPKHRKAAGFPTSAERLESLSTTSGQWAMLAGAAMSQPPSQIPAEVAKHSQTESESDAALPQIGAYGKCIRISQELMSTVGVIPSDDDLSNDSGARSVDGSRGDDRSAGSYSSGHTQSSGDSRSTPHHVASTFSLDKSTDIRATLFGNALFDAFEDFSTQPKVAAPSRRQVRPFDDESKVDRVNGTVTGTVNHDDGVMGPMSNLTAGSLNNPFPTASTMVNLGMGGVASFVGLGLPVGEQLAPAQSIENLETSRPRLSPAEGPDVDVIPTDFVKFVAKSFINGVNPVGVIVPDRPGLPFPLLPPPWDYLLPVGAEYLFTATARLNALASVVGTIEAFNQNPQTDAMDQTYRLFSQIEASFTCDGANIGNVNAFPILDGGNELPLIKGTIDINGPLAARLDASTFEIWWQGFGHPNPLVEPGMQWVAYRTSVNIWHEVRATVYCDDQGTGHGGYLSFQGSQFPSHRLWIDGTKVDDINQGSFSDLWTASAFDWTFVA